MAAAKKGEMPPAKKGAVPPKKGAVPPAKKGAVPPAKGKMSAAQLEAQDKFKAMIAKKKEAADKKKK